MARRQVRVRVRMCVRSAMARSQVRGRVPSSVCA